MTRLKGIKLADKLVENYIRDSYGATNLMNKRSTFGTTNVTNRRATSEIHQKMENLNNMCVTASESSHRKVHCVSGDNFSSLAENIHHTMRIMNQFSTGISDLDDTINTIVPTTSSSSIRNQSQSSDEYNIDSLTSEFSTVTLQSLDIPQKIHNANKFILLTNSNSLITRINCLYKADNGDLESIVQNIRSISAAAVVDK